MSDHSDPLTTTTTTTTHIPLDPHHHNYQVAVTVPGDNSVDLFTNDLGVIVVCNDAGELQVRHSPGFFLSIELWKSATRDMKQQ